MPVPWLLHSPNTAPKFACYVGERHTRQGPEFESEGCAARSRLGSAHETRAGRVASLLYPFAMRASRVEWVADDGIGAEGSEPDYEDDFFGDDDF